MGRAAEDNAESGARCRGEPGRLVPPRVPCGGFPAAIHQLAPQLGPRVSGGALPRHERERPRGVHSRGCAIERRRRLLVRGDQRRGSSIRHTRHHRPSQEWAK